MEKESAPAPGEAEALADVRLKVLKDVLALYLSPRTLEEEKTLIEPAILAHAPSYMDQAIVVARRSGGRVVARLRLFYAKVGRDVEALGLLRPPLLRGRPRAKIELYESSRIRAADAEAALAGALSRRGFQPTWGSDPDGGAKQAEIFLTGTADTRIIETGGRRSLVGVRARLKVEIAPGSPGAPRWTQAEADAFDLSAAGAAKKALSNIGEIAGEKIAGIFSHRYGERKEMEARLAGLRSIEDALRFLDMVRDWEGVVAASLIEFSGDGARFRVFAEGMTADDLASVFFKRARRALTVRRVDEDGRGMELEWIGAL